MSNFIDAFWREHAATWNDTLVVRFPPEPNGYLHLGHAKAILANADLAETFGGRLLLRMDDTNPKAEKPEFERAIIEDLTWLGIAFDPVVRYASDHFPALEALARKLIDAGEAYIDTSSKDELARMRGSFHVPGTPSPDRALPPEVHHARFTALCRGELSAGAAVLRAKGDLASPNMLLRDCVIWRGMEEDHPRLPGWKALPTYDFAHPFCDVRDGVSLSLCSLEFEDHRPFYDRVVAWAETYGFGLVGRKGPVELEFARLDPDGGMTSKRKLKAAVDTGHVHGWDDPRLLTLRGLKARGYTPDIIKAFVRRLGVGRAAATAPLAWLDEETRNMVGNTPVGMVVNDPVLLHMEGKLPEVLSLPGGASLPMSGGRVWVCMDDTRLEADPDFFRLAPGNTVRLMGMGGFAAVDRVEDREDGRHVFARFEEKATNKSRASIHCLPVGSAVGVVVERITTWDGEGDATSCCTTCPGYAAPGALALDGLFHAPRVGWGSWAKDGVFRLLAPMKGA